MTSEVPGELHEIIAEQNTVYVAAGDYLLLPGSGVPSAGIEELEKELGAEVVLAQGITEPWVIRKAVPATPSADRCPGLDGTCLLPSGHEGSHHADTIVEQLTKHAAGRPGWNEHGHWVGPEDQEPDWDGPPRARCGGPNLCPTCTHTVVTPVDVWS